MWQQATGVRRTKRACTIPSPHRAPGRSIVFFIQGVIEYEQHASRFEAHCASRRTQVADDRARDEAKDRRHAIEDHLLAATRWLVRAQSRTGRLNGTLAKNGRMPIARC